jgi:opacity protein-like surface antigen
MLMEAPAGEATMKSARLALLAAFALPTLAVAQEPAPAAPAAPAAKMYLAAKVGAPFPVASDLDGLGPKFSVEAALGYRFNDGVAVELGLGAFNVDGTQSFVNQVGDTNTASGILTATSVTAAGKFSLPVDRLELYGLAGLGLYRIEYQIKLYDTLGNRYADQTETDTTFGFLVGAGMAFRVSPRVQLGAEAKLVIGTEDTFDEKSRFDTIVVAAVVAYSF